MGVLNNLAKKLYSLTGNIRLTETQRNYIWSTFGNFTANQFALNNKSLIHNSYESNVDCYAVIRKIIEVSKAIPWIVEQRQRDGSWIEITDTTIHELMATPNIIKKYTWDDIEEMILLHILANGNSYMVSETGIGATIIEEVDVLPSFSVCIETNGHFFNPSVYYKFELDRTKRTFDSEQVEHIKLFNPSYTTVTESMYGLSAIQVAAKVIQVSNDRWDADANLLQNRGAVGLITDKGNRPMTVEEAQQVQTSFDNQTAGTHNFGRVKVTNKDLNYIQMAMSPADLQLLEKGVVNLRSLCNVFGLDSSLFNDPDNKTYNNRKEAEKSMFTNAIIPLSGKIAEAHTRYIAKNHFPDGSVRMRQDFSNIEVLQENFADKAKTVVALKMAGIITENEARNIIDYESIVGGDTLKTQSTQSQLTPATDTGQQLII